ncbi:hypothetical protein ElyMa_003301700, partial [Elysia marginata]
DLKKTATDYRSKCTRTGGGGKIKEPPYYDLIMGIIGLNSAIVNGIPGVPKVDTWGEISSITVPESTPENDTAVPKAPPNASQQLVVPLPPLPEALQDLPLADINVMEDMQADISHKGFFASSPVREPAVAPCGETTGVSQENVAHLQR